MNETVVVVLSIVAFVVLVGLTTGWALVMQQRALRQQSDAMASVDEQMELSRHHHEMAIRMLALAEESVRQQSEMIRLLKLLAEPPATAKDRVGGTGFRNGCIHRLVRTLGIMSWDSADRPGVARSYNLFFSLEFQMTDAVVYKLENLLSCGAST